MRRCCWQLCRSPGATMTLILHRRWLPTPHDQRASLPARRGGRAIRGGGRISPVQFVRLQQSSGRTHLARLARLTAPRGCSRKTVHARLFTQGRGKHGMLMRLWRLDRQRL